MMVDGESKFRRVVTKRQGGMVRDPRLSRSSLTRSEYLRSLLSY